MLLYNFNKQPMGDFEQNSLILTIILIKVIPYLFQEAISNMLQFVAFCFYFGFVLAEMLVNLWSDLGALPSSRKKSASSGEKQPLLGSDDAHEKIQASSSIDRKPAIYLFLLEPTTSLIIE